MIAAWAPVDLAWAVSSLRPHEAALVTGAGEQIVRLPHRLAEADVPASGGTVRYRVNVELERPPGEPLGVLVNKWSLSGQLYLNGQWAAACGHGPLERLRCHHRSWLFVPSPALWRAGTNVLEFEVYANGAQSNGLGRIEVAPAAELDRGTFLRQRLWQDDTLVGLSWMSLALGVMMLAVGLVLRQDTVYTWFGLTGVSNALSNLNAMVVHPWLSTEWFGWFVFSSRMVACSLLLLALLAYFQHARGVVRRALLAFTWLSPLVIAWSENNRWVVQALYVPLGIAALAVAGFVVRQALRSRKTDELLVMLTVLLLTGAGVLDFMRLGGQGTFEGNYLLAYANTALLVFIGGLLVSQLAQSLRLSKELTEQLDDKVTQRTLELEDANRQLATLSRTDVLTGLANRRHFDQTFQDKWRSASRLGTPLSVLMVDVDHFKHYNDTQGHLAGDQCLRQVAQALAKEMHRAGDHIARYGGEEFVVVADVGMGGAVALGEKMLAAVRALRLAHPGTAAGHVTISVGIACASPGPQDRAEQLLQLADETLYRAKNAGRDQLQSADFASRAKT